MPEGSEFKFGSQTPFAEPAWYDSRNASPYYNEHHVKFRNQMREFVDKEIIPNVDEWEQAGEIPKEVYLRASEVGLIPSIMGWPEDIMGKRPEGNEILYLLHVLFTQTENSKCSEFTF